MACSDCNDHDGQMYPSHAKEHEEGYARCVKCKACLYEKSKWLGDEYCPLFECLVCGTVNLCD